jgi:hypothetical protein
MSVLDDLNDMLNNKMPNMNRDEFNSLDHSTKQAVCTHCLKAFKAMEGDITTLLNVFPICATCSEKNPSTGQSIFDDMGSQMGGMFRTESSQTHTQSYQREQRQKAAKGRQDYVGRPQQKPKEPRYSYSEQSDKIDDTVSMMEKVFARRRRERQQEQRQAQRQADEYDRESARRQRMYEEAARKEKESAYTSFSTEECPPYGPFCYELLGISNDGYPPDRQVVKKAYRRKALQTHPDRGGNAEKFKIINNAYTTIVDKYSF